MKRNKISEIFTGLAVTNSLPRLRQKLVRWFYNKIASGDTSGKLKFMNYGYHDEKDKHLLLKDQDEPFRYSIQPYNHVVKNINLKDKDIIEVGCGRGGGGTFLLNNKNPRSYIGIDLSEKAIEWCRQHYQYENASWKQGSAVRWTPKTGQVLLLHNLV